MAVDGVRGRSHRGRTARRAVVLPRRLPFRRWRRRRSVHWVVAAGLAAVSAMWVVNVAANADATRRAWGATRPVAVAVQRLEPGRVVGNGDAVLREWPASLVPAGALDAVPVGRTVRTAIAAGEPLLGERVAPDGLRGLAALVPPGYVAVAVPTGPTVVAAAPDDVVSLVAAFGAGTGTRTGGDADAKDRPAYTLTDNARVLAVDEKTMSVAVRADDAPAVALAITTGTVVVVLRGA